MNIKKKLLPLALAIGGSTLLGMALVYALLIAQINELKKQLELTSPIVVVDFVKLAALQTDEASEQEFEALLVATRNKIQRLTDAGYLVLDQQYVHQAPADIVYPFVEQ